MNNILEDDDEIFDEEFQYDIKIVESNLPVYSSKKLCEMIVCNRYFGSYKEIAILCMQELSKRRVAGDNFDFEKYIEDSYNELPKLNFILPNITDTLQQIIQNKK